MRSLTVLEVLFLADYVRRMHDAFTKSKELVIALLGEEDAATFLSGYNLIIKSDLHPKVHYRITNEGYLYILYGRNKRRICRLCIGFADPYIPRLDLAMALHQLAISDEARLWQTGNIIAVSHYSYVVANRVRRRILHGQPLKRMFKRVVNWLRSRIKKW